MSAAAVSHEHSVRGHEASLDHAEWQPRQERHAAEVDMLIAGRRERAGRGEPHPVEDFLFTYYSFRPARLRRWHAGIGVRLRGDAARDRLAWRGYDETATGVGVSAEAFAEDRGATVRHVRDLLSATASRPLQLGCFGLHEWAMVYRTGEHGVRHEGWPLRLGAEGTDDVVRGHRLRCTHHDAFRFFTPEAVPLNLLAPTREDQVRLEQPGCLHASMDLYKWAYKLTPAVCSDLVLDCFRLARDVREMDMRASPYDLRALGYEPVAIETSEGKAAYVAAQRDFAERARPLRAALNAVCERVLASS